MAAVRPIVIYSRKSKFTGKGESIENQIEMCRQYIRLQFGDDAAEQALVYEDEGFSGGRPMQKKKVSVPSLSTAWTESAATSAILPN